VEGDGRRRWRRIGEGGDPPLVAKVERGRGSAVPSSTKICSPRMPPSASPRARLRGPPRSYFGSRRCGRLRNSAEREGLYRPRHRTSARRRHPRPTIRDPLSTPLSVPRSSRRRPCPAPPPATARDPLALDPVGRRRGQSQPRVEDPGGRRRAVTCGGDGGT
jgi:hypothetical protein